MNGGIRTLHAVHSSYGRGPILGPVSQPDEKGLENRERRMEDTQCEQPERPQLLADKALCMTFAWMISVREPRNCAPKRRLVKLAVTACAALLLTGSVVPVGAKSFRDARRYDSVQSRPFGTPLMAIVALGSQRITIYDAEGWILRAPISSGQPGYETPAGVYSVIQKEAEHYSNLYDDASMPFMQRITWSGIALHAGHLPGYAASHGCVRMPYDFAEQLFDMTKLGMRVIVVRNDVSPAPIVHPALFKPKLFSVPPADGQGDREQAKSPDAKAQTPDAPPKSELKTLAAIAADKVARANAAARKAEEVRRAAVKTVVDAGRAATAVRMAEIAKIRAQVLLTRAQSALEAAQTPDVIAAFERAKAEALAKIDDAEAQIIAAKADIEPKAEAAARAKEEIKAAQEARIAAFEAAEEAERKLTPVSVFISRKTQRLYVRQNFQPVFDTPVTIRDADEPIGTHIYTALDYTKQGADMRWSVVSMSGNADRYEWSEDDGRRRRGDRRAESPPTDASAARAALDRVTIPQDAIDRISELVSPDSSLIISDEGISQETGNGTDFVVLMSGEPHGGIAMRHRRYLQAE
jgi:L,D-transpeptidase catalytic domain